MEGAARRGGGELLGTLKNARVFSFFQCSHFKAATVWCFCFAMRSFFVAICGLCPSMKQRRICCILVSSFKVINSCD